MRCQCGATIGDDHLAFLGMLTVQVATVGASLIDAHGRIIILRNKVTGKQHGKRTPEHIRSQRAHDLAQLAALEDSLPRMEGVFAGMRFRIRELELQRHEERVKRG